MGNSDSKTDRPRLVRYGRIAFAVAMPLLLALPSLVYLGVQDVGTLEGKEAPADRTAFSVAAFVDGSWQRGVAERFGKGFFLRRAAVRTCNQIYEWTNLGLLHRASDGQFKSLADGALVEDYYVTPYLENASAESAASAEAWKSLGRIAEFLGDHGVDTMLVLAPDKPSLYPSPLPGYARKLWRIRRGPLPPDFAALARRHRIPVLDAYSLLRDAQTESGEGMFPYAGVHWNARAAALVVDRLLTGLNADPSCIGGYQTVRFLGLEESDVEIYEDADLGRLLNLWSNPFLRRNRCRVAKFEPRADVANAGSVLLFGDSFSDQLYGVLGHSRSFAWEKLLLCDKRMPTDEELARILPDLRLAVFIYQPPHCLTLGGRLGELIAALEGKLRTFERWPERGVPLRIGDPEVFASGFSFIEGGFIWTEGPTAILNIPIPAELRGQAVSVRMRVFALPVFGTPAGQRVKHSVNGGPARDITVVGEQELKVEIGAAASARGTVVLRYDLPDAATPRSIGAGQDERKLALCFKRLTVGKGR